MTPAEQYAEDVKAGKIRANKWVRLACKRFLKDMKRDFAYRYDDAKAAKAVDFIQALPHVRHPALRGPGDTNRLHQAVYQARAHTGYVTLRDHHHQGPLGAPTRLEQPPWKAWPEPVEG